MNNKKNTITIELTEYLSYRIESEAIIRNISNSDIVVEWLEKRYKTHDECYPQSVEELYGELEKIYSRYKPRSNNYDNSFYILSNDDDE